MSTKDSYKDVRELAQTVAATEDPSPLDWAYLYSRHSRGPTDWHRDFEHLVEQSEQSRKEIADEFCRVYTDSREQSNGDG